MKRNIKGGPGAGLRAVVLTVLAAMLVSLAACGGEAGEQDPVSVTGETSAPVTESETVKVTVPETTAESIQQMASRVNVNLSKLSAPETSSGKTDGKLERSAKPEILVTKHCTNKQIFVAGRCAENAVIHIRGGLTDKLYHPDHNSFWGTAELPDDGAVTISITAEEPGKAESEALTLTARARTDVKIYEKHGDCGVIVGDYFQGFFNASLPDYTGASVLSDKAVESLRTAMTKKYDFLKSIDCELIYYVIPNPCAIYPEWFPESYEHNEGERRFDQLKAVAGEVGATFIDMTDLFVEHKHDEFKLYHNTDSHWTEYGSYLGYTLLADHLAGTWPDCAPRPKTDYRFYTEEVYIADMATHLEFGNDQRTLMTEVATFADLLFDNVDDPNIWVAGRNELNFDPVNKERKEVNRDTERELPKAYILRDSFSTPTYSMLNDLFSETYWLAMWNYKFDQNSIKSFDPDVLIYLVTERNIKAIMN